MRFAGDETKLDVELTAAALDVLRKVAMGDGCDEQIRTPRLSEAMEHACSLASTMADAEPDPARRMAATAAVMLVQNSTEIFLDYPQLPEQDPDVYGTSYLVGSAWLLAESVAERWFTASENRPDARKGLMVMAQSGLIAVIEDVVAEHERIVAKDATHQRGAWLTKSITRVNRALGAYHADAEDLIEQQRPQLEALLEDQFDPELTAPVADHHPMMSSTDATLPVDSLTTTSGEGDPPSPRPPPVISAPFPRRAGRLVVATISATAVATTVVLVVIGHVFPALPRAVFPSRQQSAGPVSTAISSSPPSASEVLTPRVLPNTTVQLFLLSGGEVLTQADSTLSGQLPKASGPVVPQLYDDLSFQVWLSVRDPSDPPDPGLQLSIGATAPMTVKNSVLKMDLKRQGAGEPQPLLDTQPNGSSGTAVDVPPLVAGSAMMYQFDVEAHPADNSNGYMCGYNAKSVQVLVRRKGASPDDRVYVATPYPLYVARGKDC